MCLNNVGFLIVRVLFFIQGEVREAGRGGGGGGGGGGEICTWNDYNLLREVS